MPPGRRKQGAAKQNIKIIAMTRIILLTLMLLASHNAHTQTIEKVHLKDSVTVHEGIIIEQAPARYIKLFRISQKDTLVVAMADILKITRSVPSKYLGTKTDKSKDTVRGRAFSPVVYLGAHAFDGLGLSYSLNYDRRINRRKRDGFGIRIGIGANWLPTRGNDTTTLSDTLRVLFIPIGVNYVIGKKRHQLELGLTLNYMRQIRTGNAPPPDLRI
jgi:hypothetical protein